MRNLVTHLMIMSGEYKAKPRLNMLSGDEYQHMIHYSSNYNDTIFDYVIKSKTIFLKPIQPMELTVSHLHSYICARGYTKGIGSMSAKVKSDACARRYTNGIGLMSSEAKSDAWAKKYPKLMSDWEEKFAEF